MKYYFCENAHRPFRVNGTSYSPEVVSYHGGTAQGVMAINDDEVAALLAATGKMLEEITVEAYKDFRAKKKRPRASLPSASPKPRIFDGASSIKGRGAPGAVAMPGGASLALAADALPVSAADAVKIERISVEAPPASGESAPAPVRAARKSSKKTSANAATVANPAAVEPSLSPDEPAL